MPNLVAIVFDLSICLVFRQGAPLVSFVWSRFRCSGPQAWTWHGFISDGHTPMWTPMLIAVWSIRQIGSRFPPLIDVDHFVPIKTAQAESVCSNGSASVYGNIYNSELHHMFTAVYMIGHQQADVRGNVLYNNERSGKTVLIVIFSLSPVFCLFSSLNPHVSRFPRHFQLCTDNS